MKFLILSLLVCTAFICKVNGQDIDHDGVQDAMDNCKFTYNPDQADSDNDQIGDKCDCEPLVSDPTGQHTPAILITASPSTTINIGTLVTFSSVTDAGGSAPIYQWKKNGLNVGSNSSTYLDSLLIDGDTITCELTSDVSCAAGSSRLSNALGFVVNTLSVAEQYVNLIKVYPNPSNHEIYIQSGIKIDNVEIMDLSGKKIIALKVENSRINVESLNAGVYILKIHCDEKSVVKKIAIE